MAYVSVLAGEHRLYLCEGSSTVRAFDVRLAHDGTGKTKEGDGPDRRVRWLGRFVNTFDTTDGCVGLASDEEMQVISSWIRRKHANKIVLVAPKAPIGD